MIRSFKPKRASVESGTVAAVSKGHSGTMADPPRSTNVQLYSDANPLRLMDFSARTELLGQIDDELKAQAAQSAPAQPQSRVEPLKKESEVTGQILIGIAYGGARLTVQGDIP